KQHQTELQTMYQLTERDTVKLKELMTSTYTLQRADINQNVSVSQLLQLWPFLFTPYGLFVHFEQLTGVPVLDTVRASFSTKGRSVISFFRTVKSGSPVIVCMVIDDLDSESSTVLGVFLL